ncbi:MAG: O-antigen ligase family protein [Pseudomonadota bacterium]
MGIPFAVDKSNSLHDFIFYLLKYSILFLLVTNFFGSKRRFIALTWIIILSSGLFIAGGIIYFYIIKGEPISTRFGLPEAGIGVNYIGVITVIPIFLSLTHLLTSSRWSHKMLLLLHIFIASSATALTQTRGTFLGMILPALLLFFRRRKGLVAFVVFTAIVFALLPSREIFTSTNLRQKWEEEERKGVWYTYIQIAKDNPLTGIGFGMETYNKKLLKAYDSMIPEEFAIKGFHAPHNVFLDTAVRLGFVGLGLFCSLILISIVLGIRLVRYGKDAFVRNWSLCLVAAIISCLVQGMFADILLNVTVMILFVILAMTSILYRLNQDLSSSLRDRPPDY